MGSKQESTSFRGIAQREELFVMSGQATELWWVRGCFPRKPGVKCRVVWLWLENGEDPTVAAKSSSSIEAEDWV